MKVIVNSQVKEFKGEKASELMISLNLSDTRGIALAINEEIIPKTQWQNHLLRENDKVIIITATQGG